ncbi:MAG TPA: acyltransferase [Chromatiales bacterium]|nr:acyltransferase [Chromatiales bacterium]
MTLPLDLDERRLGKTSGAFMLEMPEEQRRTTLHMVSQARRQLDIFTRDLNEALYGRSPFPEEVQRLALHSRYSRIRILLQDNSQAVKNGHRLVEMARHLSSVMEIRRPTGDHLLHPEGFLLADEGGYIRQQQGGRHPARADFNAPGEVRRLRALFDNAWEMATPDQELRRLYL